MKVNAGERKPMPWNIPNLLTISRVLAAPLFGLVFVVFWSPLADWIALVLFIVAALTDYLDGYLARKWNQTSAFGKMLDPIADKAMVMIALLILSLKFGGDMLIVIPVIAIYFREVLVSGMREFMGTDAARLSVTKLAKWKTATQMIAVILLLGYLILAHYVWAQTIGMSPEIIAEIMDGKLDDMFGLRWKMPLHEYGLWIATGVLWLAALLTLITGWDYFHKTLPILRERDQ